MGVGNPDDSTDGPKILLVGLIALILLGALALRACDNESSQPKKQESHVPAFIPCGYM